jgi:hypothetical protein
MERMTLNGGWLEFFMDELTNRACAGLLVHLSCLSACLPVLPYKEHCCTVVARKRHDDRSNKEVRIYCHGSIRRAAVVQLKTRGTDDSCDSINLGILFRTLATKRITRQVVIKLGRSSHQIDDSLDTSETEFLHRLRPDGVRQCMAVGIVPPSESVVERERGDSVS